MKVNLELRVSVDQGKSEKFKIQLDNLVLPKKDRQNHKLWADLAFDRIRKEYNVV